MDVDEARDLAWVFLHRNLPRWSHVEAAGRRAEELSPSVSPGERDLLVAAAWLHDIGYSEPLRHTGFHPLDGARYLEYAGHRRIADLVAHHSGARFVAEVRGLESELEPYAFEESPVTDALTYADQSVGPRGQRLSVAQRLADTVRRHGPTAPNSVVRHLREPYVLAAAERVERRLAAARTSSSG